MSVSICLLEIVLRFSLERLVVGDLEKSLFVSPSLSLETFVIFSLFVVKVSGASKQKSSCRTSSSSTILTGNDFFVFDDYICCSFQFVIFFIYSRDISTGILIRLNLEFTFAYSAFNVDPFSFFVVEYSRSSVLCKFSFSSLKISELSYISKVMFFIFCINDEIVVNRDLLRLAISVANLAFSVR